MAIGVIAVACGSQNAASRTACERITAVAAIGATAPAARDFPALAYDASTCQVVLFGGGTHTDTWTWDATGWTEQHPAHVPAATTTELAAYDPIGKQVVLVGTPTPGVNGGVTTWSWTGGDWRQLSTAHQPSVLDHASLVLDANSGRLVLVSSSPQSWEWSGSDWAPNPTPPALGADVVFDASLGTLVAIDLGGQGGGPIVSKLVPGTSGGVATWQQYDPPTGAFPDYPIGYSIYHDAIGKVVYFMPARDQGSGNQTWTWSDGTWTLWPPGAEPNGFWRNRAVYDSALQAVVFFGGGTAQGGKVNALNQTWVLTTEGWTRVG